jgi:hypothetical protein
MLSENAIEDNLPVLSLSQSTDVAWEIWRVASHFCQDSSFSRRSRVISGMEEAAT